MTYFIHMKPLCLEIPDFRCVFGPKAFVPSQGFQSVQVSIWFFNSVFGHTPSFRGQVVQAKAETKYALKEAEKAKQAESTELEVRRTVCPAFFLFLF